MFETFRKTIRKAFPSKAAGEIAQSEPLQQKQAVTLPGPFSKARERFHVRVRGWPFQRTVYAKFKDGAGRTSVVSLMSRPGTILESRLVGDGHATVFVNHRALFETEPELAEQFVAQVGSALVGGRMGGALRFGLTLLGLALFAGWLGANMSKPARPAFAENMATAIPAYGEPLPGMPETVQAPADASTRSQPFPMMPPPVNDFSALRNSQIASAQSDLSKFGLGAAKLATNSSGPRGGGILDPKNPVIAQCPSPGGK
jgi:hypothetical protein